MFKYLTIMVLIFSTTFFSSSHPPYPLTFRLNLHLSVLSIGIDRMKIDGINWHISNNININCLERYEYFYAKGIKRLVLIATYEFICID